MRGIILFSFAIFLAFCGLIEESTAQESQVDAAVEVARTVSDLNEITAQIQTKEALDRYLAAQLNTPFDALASQERSAFIDSLVFTRRGLASYSSTPLQNLSISSAYKLLALFGLQDQVMLVARQAPKTKLEESMAFFGQLSSTQTSSAELPPIRHKFCSVVGPKTSCKYEYGSYCNARCDAVEEH